MSNFNKKRSQLYKEALREFPNARDEDIEVMKKFLKPKKNETILEIGAGSGFFSGTIADMVMRLIVTDPSEHQLEAVKNLRDNIEVKKAKAENIKLRSHSVDAIWSFGAMHHCFNKVGALKNFARLLHTDGRIVIADVWHGSRLAKHFDDKVAKYCLTGHEVAFWTDEFAESACQRAGLLHPIITELDIKWKFKKKNDIGKFLFKLHAMTKLTPKECLQGASSILGIEKGKDGMYYLNWPMKILETSLAKWHPG